uniref:Uncharacterized protein n=1 Tax=Cannabis sativa TaxID=3483 RepID=A0A803Q9U1_CANSA
MGCGVGVGRRWSVMGGGHLFVLGVRLFHLGLETSPIILGVWVCDDILVSGGRRLGFYYGQGGGCWLKWGFGSRNS